MKNINFLLWLKIRNVLGKKIDINVFYWLLGYKEGFFDINNIYTNNLFQFIKILVVFVFCYIADHCELVE